MVRRLVAALLVSAGLAAPAAAAPQISEAWIRALPGSLPAGGYFTLRNPGPKPIDLVGAKSPACSSVMLHITHEMGGLTHMMMVDKVTVPPGGTLRFAPGGYHLMCMDPKNLKPGTSVPVTLVFSDTSMVTAPFAVKNAAAR